MFLGRQESKFLFLKNTYVQVCIYVFLYIYAFLHRKNRAWNTV